MKKRWINRPFGKGFLGGIVTMAACSLSMPFSDRFEPTFDSDSGGIVLTIIVNLGMPLAILLLVGWLANKALGNFGFEGFKISEEFQAKGCLGYVAGGFAYVIASIVTLSLILILT
ncbi:hypothetical protein [Candidatus Leptofilum sp.]|uniref:hypothetical protein n=1 Tax=Candidatus Leptofilum sp. TaxID=3241576 RepID=UPI003B597CF7